MTRVVCILSAALILCPMLPAGASSAVAEDQTYSHPAELARYPWQP